MDLPPTPHDGPGRHPEGIPPCLAHLGSSASPHASCSCFLPSVPLLVEGALRRHRLVRTPGADPRPTQRAVATVLPPIAQMGPSPQDPSRASTVVTARFRPATPGRPVALELRRDGRWVVVERSRLDAEGRASFTAPPSSGGPATYRVSAAAYRGLPGKSTQPVGAAGLGCTGVRRHLRRRHPRRPPGSTGSSSTTRGAAGPAPRATRRPSRSGAAPCSSACWPIPAGRPRPARRTTRRATTSATTAGGSTGTSPPSTASTSSTASRPPA